MRFTWYLFPLAAGISLVWNASRYEFTPTIISRSFWMFVKVIFFMALILLVLHLLSRGV